MITAPEMVDLNEFLLVYSLLPQSSSSATANHLNSFTGVGWGGHVVVLIVVVLLKLQTEL